MTACAAKFCTRDLLVCEGTYFLPVDNDRADRNVVFTQRHGQPRPRARKISQRTSGRITRTIDILCGDILNVNDVRAL